MIINPGATREQIMVDMAVVAFDRTALEMDRKWGIDRLVDLVTPDMAIKYGQALARMNEAISDGSDPTLAQRRANDCVRGMQAMDRVATESGAQRASEAYWEVMVDDIKLGIMADSAVMAEYTGSAAGSHAGQFARSGAGIQALFQDRIGRDGRGQEALPWR